MQQLFGAMDPSLQLMILMAFLSLLPFVLVSLTSFTRYAIVLSILKTALGTQQVPPGIVLVGLSMIMTMYTMGPVFGEMYDQAEKPIKAKESIMVIMTEGSEPLKEFMMRQTRQEDMAYFLQMSRRKKPHDPHELSIWEVAPAFMVSELRTAFEIGFLIFIPFVVIDLVISNILMALGMMMLSPTIISLPFKILIFVAVDGWALIVHGLVNSYN
jgi:flagellar biosynthesis protein FliP